MLTYEISSGLLENHQPASTTRGPSDSANEGAAIAAPSLPMDRVQLILNMAAWLIYGYEHFDHVPNLTRDRLYWLMCHN